MANKRNLNIFPNKGLISKKSPKVFDWGKEDHLAQQDSKAGRVKKFAKKTEALKWLKNRSDR